MVPYHQKFFSTCIVTAVFDFSSWLNFLYMFSYQKDIVPSAFNKSGEISTEEISPFSLIILIS